MKRSPKSTPSVEPNPSGLCMCGCGEAAPLAEQSSRRDGNVRGKPIRYLPGHHSRATRHVGLGPNPSGYCLCGCGEKTRIARFSDAAKGIVGGRPVGYVGGHQSRGGAVDYLIDPSTGCWEWQRSRSPQGYGSIRRGGRKEGAHRWYYEQHVGPIPDGLHIDHLCRNPGCVNPSHLEPVTPAENTRRGSIAKLTAAKAREIRESQESAGELAKRLGVTPGTIQKVRLGQTWRDLDAA